MDSCDETGAHDEARPEVGNNNQNGQNEQVPEQDAGHDVMGEPHATHNAHDDDDAAQDHDNHDASSPDNDASSNPPDDTADAHPTIKDIIAEERQGIVLADVGGSVYRHHDSADDVDGIGAEDGIDGSVSLSGMLSQGGSVTSITSKSFRPFDWRFQARALTPSRPSTPVRHNVSIPDESAPWDVVRWTRLAKLHGQVFSEMGRRNFGTPTCLAVSNIVVIGTAKGVVVVFDLLQNIQSIIGPGTRAPECGPVTAVAISADNTAVGAGHANGTIFTWEVGRNKPFLTITSHVVGVSVTHLGFLGARRTALVSADDRGMAFAHLATRGTGALRTVKTMRILGRYPGTEAKPSTVLAFAPLPLGAEQATDGLGLTAMLTPYLLVVVSTTPVAQTQHKSARPKDLGQLTGCLAWFPATKEDPPKLAYCWSNVLTVLVVEQEETKPDRPPTLHFRVRSRIRVDEPAVAMQWVGRSILVLLTITQRLLVVRDGTHVTDSFDVSGRHLYHADLYSPQLGTPTADAYHMSFRAYKGRLFVLGFGDVSIGALTNWHDRLVALMEHGDYVEAIELATLYYGDGLVTIGLPTDAAIRRPMVAERLVEIMGASLRFVFLRTIHNHISDGDSDDRLRRLTEACFSACLVMDNTDFLFDDVWEQYTNGDDSSTALYSAAAGFFYETLETHIINKAVRTAPPAVIKGLVEHHVKAGWESRLEDMICMLDTASLDLDQVTQLCTKHNLYDALIYVWNQALGEHVTPLETLIELGDDDTSALKMFPYLAYALTGRVYPTGDPMLEKAAYTAKCQLYWFLFGGQTGAFPHLKKILALDAPSLLSALNEAFEDPFLNTDKILLSSTTTKESDEATAFGESVDRQYIVSVLLDVMRGEPALDMFIARNLAKFPQYLLLPSSTLAGVLQGLCKYPDPEDAQLSVEYLLSVYKPHDLLEFVPLFREAGFFRILKRIYRSEAQHANLVEAYFDDPDDDKDGMYECVEACLKTAHDQVFEIVLKHGPYLVEHDVERASVALARLPAWAHLKIIEGVDGAHAFYYLEGLPRTDRALYVRHIQLMCQLEPDRVVSYINESTVDLMTLEEVAPAMEDQWVVDGVIALMVRLGQISDAMDRLVRHLVTLEEILHNPTERYDFGTALLELQKYIKVGIGLCGQAPRRGKNRKAVVPWGLSLEEAMWLALIDTIVQLAQRANKSPAKVPLRGMVQEAFTALLAATATSTPATAATPVSLFSPMSPMSPADMPHSVSFLRVLRTFLTQAAASSPTIADLREVLESIFSAHVYEESILQLSNRLLEQSLFVSVDEAAALRQRGWRPRSSTCEGCAKRAWGPGVAGVYEAWEARAAAERKRAQGPRGPDRARWKGKAKSRSVDLRGDVMGVANVNEPGPGPGPLVLLACRHVYHYKCLAALQTHHQEEELLCPLHEKQ